MSASAGFGGIGSPCPLTGLVSLGMMRLPRLLPFVAVRLPAARTSPLAVGVYLSPTSGLSSFAGRGRRLWSMCPSVVRVRGGMRLAGLVTSGTLTLPQQQLQPGAGPALLHVAQGAGDRVGAVGSRVGLSRHPGPLSCWR